MPALTLYGKPGCHLCDDARAVVQEVCAGRHVDLAEVDVTLGPVLELDGEELFELFVDPHVLREALDRVDV